jgi:hypothetical protein
MKDFGTFVFLFSRRRTTESTGGRRGGSCEPSVRPFQEFPSRNSAIGSRKYSGHFQNICASNPLRPLFVYEFILNFGTFSSFDIVLLDLLLVIMF